MANVVINFTPKLTGNNTNALVNNQGYTYNQAGFTYNQAGVTYGGLYYYNQDVIPISLNILSDWRNISNQANKQILLENGLGFLLENGHDFFLEG